MCALLGVLMAFSPSIGKTAQLAEYMVKERQMSFEIEKVFGALVEVNAIGKGSKITGEAYFPIKVSFFSEGNFIVAEYGNLGKKRRITREIGNVVIENGKVEADGTKFIVEGTGDGAKLSFPN
jgi:hypothetical protein